MDDMALLREYATRHSEAAFEALVSRRVGFVYAAALRQVRDQHLAEDSLRRFLSFSLRRLGKFVMGPFSPAGFSKRSASPPSPKYERRR